jgi:two-component system, NarL family, nitrate/nitrite response regulator NarL
MIRLLIADDHPIIVAGLKMLLRGTEYEVVCEVADGEDVLAAVADGRPDIVLLDQQMPNKSGIEIYEALRASGDRTPVVLLTGNITEDSAMAAIESGIDGLVFKYTAPDQLVTCLDEVREGRRWIDQGLLRRALDRALEHKEKAAFLSRLSPREQEIVRLLAAGLRNDEIGERLGITLGTVKVHLHNVYGKLGLSDRTDLMQLIRDSGLDR